MFDAERFLKELEPFNRLPTGVIRQVVQSLQVKFYPKGDLILEEGRKDPDGLFIVRSGVVALIKNSEVVELLREGEYFDFVSLLTGRPTSYKALSYQDSLIFILPIEVFKNLCKEHEDFNLYFIRKIAGGFEAKMNKETIFERLGSVQVKDLKPKKAAIFEGVDSVENLIKYMVKEDRRAVLVKLADGFGIITERDIIKKVLAEGRNIKDTKLSEIASFPIISVSMDDYLMDVITVMSRHALRRVVVTEGVEPVAILEDRDIVIYGSQSFMFVFKEIEKAKTEEDLTYLYRQTFKAVAELVLEGADPERIGKFVSEINDRFMQRAAWLATINLGEEPKVPYVILVLGSEGRQEQSLKTDQDNALIYREVEPQGFDPKEYFKRFSEEYIRILLAIGFPPCPGKVMVSNPEWRDSDRGWKKKVGAWIETPKPENLLNSAIFFDFRAVYGDQALADELEEFVQYKIKGQGLFMRYFLQEGLKFRPPITLLGRLAVEKVGKTERGLDVKKGGIFPITHGVRCLCLAHNVPERNTYDRIRKLMEKGLLNKEFGCDLLEAYRFLNGLRLRSQAEKLMEGKEPDNYINPDKLSRAELNLLKDAFKIVKNFQEHLEDVFGRAL